MPVLPFRMGLLFVAAMTTATSVCVSGNIGFVGLVVPHMMRMLVGPDHRVLLPASALAGAAFLVVCDSLGRIVIPPAEVRVGIMTALLERLISFICCVECRNRYFKVRNMEEENEQSSIFK